MITSGAWRRGVLQRVLPAVGVDADLALGDDAAFVLTRNSIGSLDGDDAAGLFWLR